MQYDILQLNEMLVNELRDVAENLNVSNYRKLNKQALIFKILDHQTATGTIINQNTAILSPPPPSTTDTQPETSLQTGKTTTLTTATTMALRNKKIKVKNCANV